MPDLKVKIGLIGKLDMLKFKNMKKVREQVIQAAPAREVKGDFPINNNAKALKLENLKGGTVDEVLLGYGGTAHVSGMQKNEGGKTADERR